MHDDIFLISMYDMCVCASAHFVCMNIYNIYNIEMFIAHNKHLTIYEEFLIELNVKILIHYMRNKSFLIIYIT